MSLGLNPGETPELFKDKQGDELPIESLKGTDKTAYLKIDLKIHPMGGRQVPPMTAVFAPEPTKLSGDVDILLWFHGDKHYWDNDKVNVEFPGESIQYYLNQPKFKQCKLREFILQTSKRQFLLVAPTLNDRTGISVSKADGDPGGLRWESADAEAYLKQVINGVKKHLGANVTGVGKIVLAAHSGGGHLQGQMARFSGMFDRVNEIWSFDSMYWGSAPFTAWAAKGHSNPRLWVYSTGGTTGYNARKVKELTDPPPAPKPAHARSRHAVAVAPPPPKPALTTKIEVLIEHAGPHRKALTTDGFDAAYGGPAGGHYEGIGKYLPTLVANSGNLK